MFAQLRHQRVDGDCHADIVQRILISADKTHYLSAKEAQIDVVQNDMVEGSQYDHRRNRGRAKHFVGQASRGRVVWGALLRGQPGGAWPAAVRQG
ncbi:hypothetical protein FACS1894184_18640 [Clostridia bacterium]|nr:hypothetical protein FACS1894184_18640 [Clostridia bacterium]